MTTTSAMSGCFCAVADAHVDRQRLLDRRLLVAAGAVAPRPADHHEALAEVADVDLEGEPSGARSATAAARRRGRSSRRTASWSGSAERPGGGDRVDVLALDLEAPTRARRRPTSSPDTTRIRGSPLTIVFESARSFWLNVFWAASTTARKRTKPASSGLTLERDLVRARLEIDAARCRPARRSRTAGRSPAGQRSNGCPRPPRSPRRAATSTASSAARSRTSSAPTEADDPRLDLDPAGRREGGLGLALAGRVVAVGEQDDPLLGVVGEQRRGETERRPDVGRGPDRRRRDPVDLAELGRQSLDQRALAERRRFPPRRPRA